MSEWLIGTILFLLSLVNCEQPAGDTLQIFPAPQQMRIDRDQRVDFSLNGQINIGFTPDSLHHTPVVNAGIRIFMARLGMMADSNIVVTSTDKSHCDIILRITEPQQFKTLFDSYGFEEMPEDNYLTGAYLLTMETDEDRNSTLVISGTADRGLYYGLLTAMQLIKPLPDKTSLPQLAIADWPHMPNRLAKFSGSVNDPQTLRRYTNWLPFLRFNYNGLQFHREGKADVFPRYRSAVQNECSRSKTTELIDVITYVSPFLHLSEYDFKEQIAPTTEKYLDFLLWALAQGAAGVEIDYNDFGKGDDIAAFINKIYNVVKSRYPQARVLYCAPNEGPEQYRGLPSPRMQKTIKSIPDDIWVLWTGAIHPFHGISPEHATEWAQLSGRKPFYWINGISYRGVKVKYRGNDPKYIEIPGYVHQPSIVRLGGDDDAVVFNGSLQPRNLNSLFEGTHFNVGFTGGDGGRWGWHILPETVPLDGMVYLATAADYIWNPVQWSEKGSWRRAKRYVDMITPIVSYLLTMEGDELASPLPVSEVK
ncbi:MAG: glycoside hydrolase family 20 zincin-like fold domain-containing protein [candidate division KSB1 bacterium]|jgi:hypothetical protein|nr:glycoside hydrolase family 20 zincin-like fold domain-containing protein [candidate division KSB1 bacterium]